MRKGGGKQKGAQFERDVCVMLSKWITDNVQMDVFWRSAMSGGRATVAAKGSKLLSNQVGDLSCIDPVGSLFLKTFAVECKFYADLDYTGLLTGKGKLLQFWAEINKQAAKHKKHPMLIVRQNRMPTHICFDRDGANKLGLSQKHMILISRPYNLLLMGADKFVEVCTPYR